MAKKITKEAKRLFEDILLEVRKEAMESLRGKYYGSTITLENVFQSLSLSMLGIIWSTPSRYINRWKENQ